MKYVNEEYEGKDEIKRSILYNGRLYDKKYKMNKPTNQ